MNKRGLGELPKSKSKTHEKFKTEVLFFSVFSFIFRKVHAPCYARNSGGGSSWPDV